MAYSDGLMVLGMDLAATQVEAAAVDIKTWVFPYPVSIEAFGVLVTETFAAHATDPVVRLSFKDKDIALTTILDLTIGSAALKRGNGSKAAQTALAADTEIVVDDVALAKGTSLPKRLAAGSSLTVRHQTAAGELGGAYIPVVLVRVEGYDNQATRILS